MKVEEFWLERNLQEKWKWKKLSKFTTYPCIQHVIFVESMFSYVNIIKIPSRNLLSSNSVSSILKTKFFILSLKIKTKRSVCCLSRPKSMIKATNFVEKMKNCVMIKVIGYEFAHQGFKSLSIYLVLENYNKLYDILAI